MQSVSDLRLTVSLTVSHGQSDLTVTCLILGSHLADGVALRPWGRAPLMAATDLIHLLTLQDQAIDEENIPCVAFRG